jgi:hypothetical protein
MLMEMSQSEPVTGIEFLLLFDVRRDEFCAKIFLGARG